MKLYTRTGDKGQTSLFSGERVPKNHERVAVYGEIDELNTCLGIVCASLPDLSGTTMDIQKEIRTIQSELFTIGAIFATSPDSGKARNLGQLDPSRIDEMEKAIDKLSGELPPLKHFILPGGHISAAFCHLARTVCRRVERGMIGLNQASGNENHPDEPFHTHLKYINRLSDFLFVLARYLNHIIGESETLFG